ncbi:hypothetical protein BH11ACT7_BH11ACT7_26890 [soil metagenome]
MESGRARAVVVLAGLATLMAATALTLSIITWLEMRSTPEYTLEQQAAAKTRACAAYSTVRTGVATNTNVASPDGGVTGSLAVAENARIALIDGGQYVLARIDSATPAELADPLRQFADKLMDFGTAATAGALDTDPVQAALLADIDGLNGTLTQLCA